MSAGVLSNLTGAQFSTYRIGGPLEEAYQPDSAEALLAVLTKARNENKPVTALGWGGNTLIATAGIKGIVVITRKLDWIHPLSDTRFEFGAGCHMAKVASHALKHGLSGGEYMIGIPGTVGGAVRMNAGALGQETADVTRKVTLFDLETGETEIWDQDQLAFSYRRSAIVPGKHIVISAEMEFKPGNPQEISRLMEGSVNFRKTHHPKEPNGGSVFKNPHKDHPVGRMIEELGGKGVWQEGGAMVSPLHGNFIINHNGQATSLDVLKLMLRMKHAVKSQYGFDIHPENLFIGETTPEEQAIWAELNLGASH